MLHYIFIQLFFDKKYLLVYNIFTECVWRWRKNLCFENWIVKESLRNPYPSSSPKNCVIQQHFYENIGNERQLINEENIHEKSTA